MNDIRLDPWTREVETRLRLVCQERDEARARIADLETQLAAAERAHAETSREAMALRDGLKCWQQKAATAEKELDEQRTHERVVAEVAAAVEAFDPSICGTLAERVKQAVDAHAETRARCEELLEACATKDEIISGYKQRAGHDWGAGHDEVAETRADRDEWRTQHENLLAMYRTAEDGRAAERVARGEVLAQAAAMREALEGLLAKIHGLDVIVNPDRYTDGKSCRAAYDAARAAIALSPAPAHASEHASSHVDSKTPAAPCARCEAMRKVIVTRQPDTGDWECMACGRSCRYNDDVEHEASCPLSPAPAKDAPTKEKP